MASVTMRSLSGGDVGAVDVDGRRGRVGAGDDRRLTAAQRHGRGVVHVHAVLEHPPGHRAVHRAGVEVGQAESTGHRTAGARLARAGGAVHGHHEPEGPVVVGGVLGVAHGAAAYR